jgi:hypothetical protein
MPIVSMEVVISSTKSLNNNAVKLIVVPWKTPPPNLPEIPTGQESEPALIPLLPFDAGPNTNPDFTVYPIAYRRLQFRIATANNSRTRKLHQHFTLHLKVIGTLTNGVECNMCETATAPLTVRGRTPRNFEARKDIPLVGSPSSRVDTNGKDMAKPQTLKLPMPPFTFDSSTTSGFPSLTRQ